MEKKYLYTLALMFVASTMQVSAAEVVADKATTDINEAVTIDVLQNDTGNWVQAVFSQGGNGAVSVSGQTLLYTPDTGFTGSDSFTYSLREATGPILTATVTVNVLPVVRDDMVTTTFETPVAISFLDNDTGNWVSGSVSAGVNGSVATQEGPEILFTPNPGFTGIESVNYTLTDSSGVQVTATVTITVDPTGPGDATLPLFTCSGSDVICNVTQVAGLGGDIGSGRGVSFIDYDGDGWVDIFTADTDGRLIPGDYGVSKFYRNQGNGTYQPVDAVDLGFSEDDLFGTNGISFADFDNDGDPDVIIANGGFTNKSTLVFYRNQVNENGLFVEATDLLAGGGSVNQQLSPWWGASWADYDNDGFLDVVVTRTKGRPLLFHNNGGKSFTEVSGELGINVDFLSGAETGFENAKNPVWIDFDADGDVDLYIAGIFKHVFYENVGGTGFVDITAQIFGSTLFQNNVNFAAGKPIVHAAAAEDFNQDGFDDLYLGRWTEQDMLLLNNGDGTFQPFGPDIGLDALNTVAADITRPFENSMAIGVGDLFNDGYPDVFIGTGNPSRVGADILYCNEKDTGFRRCTDLLEATADRVYRTHGHGSAFADVDQDGNTDMFVNLGGHPEIKHDTREQNALWVRPNAPALTATLTLEGTITNRDALGAKVKVQAGDEVNYYAVRSTQGFQSQNSKSLMIAMGTSSAANVEVFWPSGKVSKATISVGQHLHIIE